MRALTVTTLLLALPAVASAQAERSVQLRSADFEAGWIELFNFGTTDVALDGWRLGSADADETLFTATAGLNGLTIEAGTSLFIHANDDAPAADPDRVDASVVGGLASPLAADGYRLALFDLTGGLTLDPADGTQLADYIQWATGGGPPTTTFTGTAVSEGLWTADGDFVVPASNTRRVDLTVVQDIEAHGPADYSLIGPTFYDEHLGLDLSGDRFNPTVLNLPIGDATLVLAQQGDFEVGGRDLDYVTITVPDGQQLTNIFL
ncbi:MAG: lamin tail domain-containing protein, partial [Planctomycetota bacterium]